MRGIILCGGLGTRLRPLTYVTNKHLLPVGDKPMVLHPLETLRSSGITDVMLVTGKEHAGAFCEFLGDGSRFGVSLTYRVQEEAGGIAQAVSLAEGFAAGGNIAVILGDNLFDPAPPISDLATYGGARIWLKMTDDPTRFGVAEFEGYDQSGRLLRIVEKPKKAPSRMAVTGLYVYDHTVFDRIRMLEPSARGELEITDVNNSYIEDGLMDYVEYDGEWTDCGTFDSLFRANQIARQA